MKGIVTLCALLALSSCGSKEVEREPTTHSIKSPFLVEEVKNQLNDSPKYAVQLIDKTLLDLLECARESPYEDIEYPTKQDNKASYELRENYETDDGIKLLVKFNYNDEKGKIRVNFEQKNDDDEIRRIRITYKFNSGKIKVKEKNNGRPKITPNDADYWKQQFVNYVSNIYKRLGTACRNSS